MGMVLDERRELDDASAMVVCSSRVLVADRQ